MINAFRFGVVSPPETPQLELITSKGSLPLAQSFNGPGSIIVAHDDKANSDAGSASVFEWSGTTWNQKGQTIIGNTDAQNGPILNDADRLQSGRLSYDGTRLLTLAPGDLQNYNKGKAQAYEYNQSNNTWETLGPEISGVNNGDNLGKVGFMSADGESIALYTGDTDQSIQRYSLIGGTNWSSTSKEALAGISVPSKTVLMTPDLEYLVYTGKASSTAGGATVYKYNPPSGTSFISPGRYQQRGSLFPDTVDNPRCTSISPDGVRLVISDDVGTNDAGRVRVYEWVETDWVQIGQDIVGLSTQPPPSDGGGSVLGYTTAINGDNLLIGERELNTDIIIDSTFGGAVKYYKYNETTDEFELKWVLDGLIDNLDDYFGTFLEFSPDGSTFMAAGGFNKNRFIYDLNTATTASYFIPIGNIGNTAFTYFGVDYGAVSYHYAISRYAVSNFDISSYNADPLNSTRQISTIGEINSDIPARINWNKAARYVNWLNIQEGIQPAYRFLTEGVNDEITLWDVADSWTAGGENRYRHKDTKYFIPSEDEWYKAAYYDPNKGGSGGYWIYPTGSDTSPVATGSFEEGSTTPGEAVYNDGVINPAPTAAVDVTDAGGLSPYGTMGQGGNVWEWNESNHAFSGSTASNDDPSASRVTRGGRWDTDSTKLHRNTGRSSSLPGTNNFTNMPGFRIARTRVLNNWSQIGSDITGTGVGDGAGISTALNDAGNIVAYASPYNIDGGANSGEIRVFERIGNNWTQVGSDIEGAPSELATNSGGGTHCVALNGAGDILATSWPGNDDVFGGNTDAGQVRVYKNVSNTWTLTGGDINALTSDTRLGAYAGLSLNTAGNIVAVGGWLGGDQPGVSDPGVVRVYEMVAGNWSQIGQPLSGETTGVTNDYNQEADYFGFSVSINSAGNIIVVGGYANDNNDYPNSSAAGHARVFENISGTWTQIGSDIDGESAGLRLGESTSINNTGNIVAVGGSGSGADAATVAGVVRIYENIAGTWTQIGSDIVGVDADDRTGWRIELNGAGDIIAVSDDVHDSATNSNIGRVRIFKNIEGEWVQHAADILGSAENEYAGWGVALNNQGDVTAVGSPGYVTPGDTITYPGRGRVRVYSEEFVS